MTTAQQLLSCRVVVGRPEDRLADISCEIQGINAHHCTVVDEAGVFRVDVEYTEAGVWYWRYESTGAVVAADQGKVIVKSERPVG